MSRIRLNSEYRNKGAVRFREHLEQENTQEKEAYLAHTRDLGSSHHVGASPIIHKC